LEAAAAIAPLPEAAAAIAPLTEAPAIPRPEDRTRVGTFMAHAVAATGLTQRGIKTTASASSGALEINCVVVFAFIQQGFRPETVLCTLPLAHLSSPVHPKSSMRGLMIRDPFLGFGALRKPLQRSCCNDSLVIFLSPRMIVARNTIFPELGG
jgi:hypothetical protein